MNARHTRRALSLAVSLAAFTGQMALAAQEEAAGSVEEFVVTANRVPVPLRQIATSVTVLDAEELEAHGNLALIDVLRQMPAIATSNSGGAGKTTSMRIRGEEGFRTLTIFDGLRLSDPSSTQIGPQLENLMSGGIGRVEILRGPQGLSYGADAGGIVNISSRTLSGTGLQLNLDAQTGEFGTRQVNVNAGGGNAVADGFISIGDFETDGFNARSADNVLRDDDGYDNTTIHMRGGLKLTDTLRFDLVHRDVDGDALYDGCFTTTTIHDCHSVSDLKATRAAFTYDGASYTHALAYATTRTNRHTLAAGTVQFPSEGELNRVEYVGSATELPGFDLVFGGDLEEAVNNGTGRDNTGVYGEVLSDFSDNLFFTAGLRHDDNDDFGTNTSHRISAAYLFDLANNGTLKFKTAFGTGFRAPSPYEISYNSGPDAYPPAAGVVLKQETSKGHEFGVEYTADALHLEAVYFDQDVEDAIEFDLNAFSGYLQDVGVSNSKGVELGGEWTLNASWHLSANYTHNETKRPNGLQRRRRPEELYNVGIAYYGMNDRLNLNAYYRASRDAIDSAGLPLLHLDDFAVVDLSANFNITDQFQIYGRLENALDEDYQEIVGYNTAGSAAYIGFRLGFSGL
jgi:vitamin B12 transporter